MKYFILTTSLILDYLLLNILPFSYENINYLHPSLFIISIFLVCSLFKNNKKYYLTSFIFGIIYGGVFLNNILLGVFLNLFISFLSILYNKYINSNNITNILGVILIIILSNTFIYLVLSFCLITDFSFYVLIYKIKRSLLLNILYSIFIYNIFLNFSSKSIF